MKKLFLADQAYPTTCNSSGTEVSYVCDWPKDGAVLDNRCLDRSNPMGWPFDWLDISNADPYNPTMTVSRIYLTAAAFLLLFSCAPLQDRQGALVSAKEGYLQGAGGVELYYHIVGTGADTVVAIHGGPGAGMNAFFPDVRPLARNHTVIFYDQRGGGRSTLPADTSLLRARYFVEDLEAVRRHFELQRMNLLAHSFGAVLAARYAEKYPERVARMIFVGSTGPSRSEAARAARESSVQMDTTTRQRMSETLRLLLDGTAEDAVAVCREYERLLDSLAIARNQVGQWQGSTCNAPPEAVRYYYHYTAQITPATFGAWDFTESFRRMRAPLLVIYGGQAKEPVRTQQKAWAAAAANGRVFVVPNAGKGALSDRPELVFPAIATFLDGRWPDEAVAPGRLE